LAPRAVTSFEEATFAYTKVKAFEHRGKKQSNHNRKPPLGFELKKIADMAAI
jgi:hypothetical protein